MAPKRLLLVPSGPMYKMYSGQGDFEGPGVIWAADLPKSEATCSVKGTVNRSAVSKSMLF